MVDAIIADPACLEVGLRLGGQNAWVADGAGETGYVDLVFTDSTGRYLLVEVKVKAGEIDQGIGQLLKQRIMFSRQNFLEDGRVRIALACPDIPPVRERAAFGAFNEAIERAPIAFEHIDPSLASQILPPPLKPIGWHPADEIGQIHATRSAAAESGIQFSAAMSFVWLSARRAISTPV